VLSQFNDTFQMRERFPARGRGGSSGVLGDQDVSDDLQLSAVLNEVGVEMEQCTAFVDGFIQPWQPDTDVPTKICRADVLRELFQRDAGPLDQCRYFA
jgi:hypothetical protein